MKAVEFAENDSASQLYWCSEGGGAGGKYYRAEQVEALISAAKRMPRHVIAHDPRGELDKALKALGV